MVMMYVCYRYVEVQLKTRTHQEMR